MGEVDEAQDASDLSGSVRTVRFADSIAEEDFLRVLRESVDVLDGARVPFLVMGGFAVKMLARPRWTRDLDVFVRPDDAHLALEAFAQAGYETKRVDPRWLFKATKEPITVDLIFRSEGDIYLDDEMLRRGREVDYEGVRTRVVPPEDLVVIKAAANEEGTGYHWYDGMALLTRADMDWSYLLERARNSIRRVLSLLIYAQSNDIGVPNWVVRQLSRSAYDLEQPDEVRRSSGTGHDAGRGDRDPKPYRAGTAGQGSAPGTRRPGPRIHESESLHDELRTDHRICDLDVHVALMGDTIVLTGDVATEERQRTLEQVVEELMPGYRVDNRTTVRRMSGEPGVEEVRVEEVP